MTRDSQRGRHRVPAPRPHSDGPEPAPYDPELDSYLAALAPGSVPGATELTGRFGSAQVFALRLPALRIEQLRRLAVARGVSPGALAVDWVLERLDQEDLGKEDTVTGPLPVPVDVDVEASSWRSALRRLGR
jgi:hypothetical protein